MSTRRSAALGDEFGASYLTLFAEMRGFFRARGVGPDEANDLAQESLVRAFIHLRRHGRQSEDLRPLIRTIARNLHIERARRASPILVPLEAGPDIVDEGARPSDEAEVSDRRREVRKAMAALTPRHRRVVALWMSGYGAAEISRALGIKRNAADALLHRARRRLASTLDGKVVPGIVGLVVIRVRSGLGKVGDTFARLDPTGAVAQATSGLAAVAITAALLAAGPAVGRRDISSRQELAPVSESATVVVNSVGGDIDARRAAHVVKSPEAVERREYRIESPKVQNPAREDEPVGLDLVYEPEYGDHHVVDSILAPAVDMVCGPPPQSCDKHR